MARKKKEDYEEEHFKEDEPKKSSGAVSKLAFFILGSFLTGVVIIARLSNLLDVSGSIWALVIVDAVILVFGLIIAYIITPKS